MAPTWLKNAYVLICCVALIGWGWQANKRVSRALVKQKQNKGPARVGKTLPTMQLQTSKGERVSAKAYRGKWVLLNFWATWCEPCRREMPSMERLAIKMKDRPFVLLAASVDSNWRIIRRFFQTHKTLKYKSLRMRLLWDKGGENARRYGTLKFPETYLIDPQGKVRQKYIGPKEWDSPKILAQLKAMVR